ncbi:MAG: maleylpyruvate isomerase N-terminal domain-containing protein, partial [Bacteroidota bacterium]|nr:maleylpyruvate isomerase N-terminal domain-containing protein [Bacteroidota bacterium]
MVEVKHLFAELDRKLIQLLKSLSPEDWEKQTVAKLWKVKDVVAHLLDGNIRVLSIQRDRYFGEQPPAISSYQDLVDWLNQLNADWVKASKRISPGVLILLHETTGPLVSAYYQSLNLQEKAIFSVAWAGEQESLNELHLAREYTEKWLHQQQIRDAVN